MSDALQKRINYTFNDPELLRVALTHRSKGGEHNERLEFLGDSVVNFVIARILFERYPDATEGELSRWRAALVNRDTLADLARKFDIGPHLVLGPGEVRSGGHERHSILSCAIEAIIGAVYLDGGYETVSKCIADCFEDLVSSLSDAHAHKDPKTLLQEFLQAKRMSLPAYNVDDVEGEAHQQVFVVSCRVDGVKEVTTGRGTSRRRAEQDAAQAMLEVVNHDS